MLIDPRMGFDEKDTIPKADAEKFKIKLKEILFHIKDPLLKTKAIISALFLPKTAVGKVFATPPAIGKKSPDMDSIHMQSFIVELLKTKPEIFEQLQPWLNTIPRESSIRTKFMLNQLRQKQSFFYTEVLFQTNETQHFSFFRLDSEPYNDNALESELNTSESKRHENFENHLVVR